MNATCVLWGFIWFLIWFFLGWPISIFLGGLYGFFAPLTTLIGLDDISEALLAGVNVGRVCAKNVLSGKPIC